MEVKAEVTSFQIHVEFPKTELLRTSSGHVTERPSQTAKNMYHDCSASVFIDREWLQGHVASLKSARLVAGAGPPDARL